MLEPSLNGKKRNCYAFDGGPQPNAHKTQKKCVIKHNENAQLRHEPNLSGKQGIVYAYDGGP